MLQCWTIIRGLAPRIPLRHLWRGIHHVSHHVLAPVGHRVIRDVARHAVHPVRAVTHLLPAALPALVCRQIATGLIAGGLVALGPGAAGPAAGPVAGGMGGFPGGFVSEYGGPGAGSGAASGAAYASAGGTGLPSGYGVAGVGSAVLAASTSGGAASGSLAGNATPTPSGGNGPGFSGARPTKGLGTRQRTWDHRYAGRWTRCLHRDRERDGIGQRQRIGQHERIEQLQPISDECWKPNWRIRVCICTGKQPAD